MGIIDDLKSIIKNFIADLRKNFGLIIIMSIIWILLLFGILFLKIYVGPLQPLPSFVDFLLDLGFSLKFIALITATIQVFIAGVYALLWLYIFHRLVRMYFWRTIKKYYPESEKSPEDKE